MGGSGNWTDLNHWATSSGGSVLHTQIPTALDDVFFDANSFTAAGQTVTLNASACLAQNMDWTGAANNPVLAGAGSTLLKIYGSLSFIPAMNLSFTGSVSFEATAAGKTITTAGKQFRNTVTFNGVGGSWTLMDAFSATAIISLNNGTLNTNNQTVTATQFTSVSPGARALNMGSSIFNLSATQCWNTSPSSGLTLNCGTSTINATNVNTGFAGGDLTYYDLNLNAGAIADNNSFHNVTFNSDGTVSGNNSFSNLTFSKNGILYGNNNFNNLVFTAGYTYTLKDGMTQTINGTLTANGNCGALISVNSGIAGSQAGIVHPPGTVTVSFIVLKDINAGGGASFVANNAVDLGNNTGWTLNTSTPKDLYWIGNAGNWSDGNHWSLSSGGAPSGCAPTPIDNVFFDANSYTIPAQTTSINIPTAYCNNMSWTSVANNPALNGSVANQLKIFGSLNFSNAMTTPFAGAVCFEASTAGQTITSMGRTIVGEVRFNGVGGTWTLMDALNCSNTIFLNSGTLHTNNNNVNASQFYSSALGTRTLNMGSSVFNLSGGTCWNVSGLNLNCGTSTINALAGNATFHGGNLIYYDLNFNGIGDLTDDNYFRNVNFLSDGTISNNNSFNNVVFSKKGTINGNNIYSTLSFTAGYTYTIRDAKTQTIINGLNATGNCGALITVNSSVPGSQTSISHPPGTVTVSYIALQDINAIGGATFIANNAIDLGNNSGWTINASTPRNLYWIGNSGNWNDGNHWSLSSGGPPSGCSPTPVDNVFFDANSYTIPAQTTSINIPTALCRDMNWTGVINNPTLAGSFANQLKIYGSLNFAAAMNQFFQGTVSFESNSTGKTITCSGKSFIGAVNFNGVGGSWTLQDAFSCNNIISLVNGTLNTNDQTVNAAVFYSSSTAARTLNMGASVFNLSSATFWNTNISTGLTLNSGTSVINSTVGAGFVGSFLGGNLQYYDLRFTNAASIRGAIFDNNSFHNVTFTSDGVIYGDNSFNNVVFNKNGAMDGSNSFNDLTFTPNFTYTLREGKIQTIAGRWQIQGSCTSYIILQSATPGLISTIIKNAGTVTGFNLHIHDIFATGGANFIAYNSVDLGGNVGWNFSTLPPLANPGNIIGPSAVCAGQTGVIYHIPPTAGAISYTWTVPPGATITSPQGDTIITVNFTGASSGNVTVTAFNGCAFSSAAVLPVTVGSTFVPAVTITTASTTICAGVPVTFTAVPVNEGSSPTYQWQVNGVNTGTNAPTFTTNALMNGDIVTLVMTSSLPCAVPASATSNSIVISISTALTPSVSIAATPGNTVCSGTAVTFTATAVNTGGGTVNYDFKVNGISVQNGALGSFNSSTLINGDVVTCDITISGGTCLTSATAASNTIAMQVNPNVTPAVLVSANPAGQICTGTMVSFTAVPSNGGTAPAYQWKLNGTNVGVNTPTYSNASLTNGDVVSVVLTSNAACATTVTVMSNSVVMNVASPVTPAVSIVASATSICSGSAVTFTASPVNGGSLPVYQWKINGVNAGTNSPSFTTNALNNGDVVSVRMNSNAACATPGTATSNSIAITVIVPAPVSVSIAASATIICEGTAVVFNATAINGGINPSYQWKINGINTGTNSATFVSNNLINGDNISCELRTINTCSASVLVNSNTIAITVNPNPVITFNPAGPSLMAGNSVQLNANVTGSIATYLWTPPAGLSNPGIHNPIASPSATTLYNLKVVTTNNCTSNKDLLVKVYRDIYIPNSFTPDGDGLNDVFRIPPGSSFSLKSFSIFNRYGNEVFRTSNIGDGWDGTYKGTKAPAGTYTYIIKGSDLRRDIMLTGTVILIR